MKKLLLLLLISSGTIAQAQFCRLDTMNRYSVSTTDVKTPVYREINEYNSANHLTKILKQNRINNEWVNFREFTITYNNLNQEIERIEKNWNNNTWENYEKHVSTFHVSGIKTENSRYSWGASNWVPLESTLYTVNEEGKITETIKRIGYITEWRNVDKAEFEFDANGNTISQTTLKWDLDASQFVKFSKVSYSYNATNKLTITENSSWNGSAFVSSNREVNTYNADDLVTRSLTENWYNNTWNGTMRFEFAYDGNKNQTSKTTQNYFGQDGWKSISAINFIYNSNNKVIEEFSLNINPFNNSSVPSAKIVFEYNSAGKHTSIQFHDYNQATTSFRLYKRENYQYNVDNELVIKETLNFNAQINGIAPTNKTTWEYNTDGLLIAIENFSSFNLNTGLYQVRSRDEYVCTNIATSSTKQINKETQSIYPNPANNEVNIAGNSNTKVVIYDAMGKIVLTSTITDSILKVDLTTFKNGMYIIKTQEGENYSTQKLLVNH